MKKLLIKPKKNVQLVPRISHWIKNREGYFTMERNERVDDFNSDTMRILNSISSFDLSSFPIVFVS